MSFLRAALVAALVVAAFPRQASAQPLFDYDMASMAFRAETIVLVDESNCRVVESIKGAFKPGDIVPLRVPSGYHRQSFMSRSDPFPSGLALLFLVRDRETGELAPFASGMKLITRQGVFGFRQINNPGGYSTVPMRPELISLPDGAAYDREALILDLRAALDKAARFQAALEDRDLATLAEFIGHKEKREPWGRRDELSRRAAQAFREHGDLDLNLGLLARKFDHYDSIEFREITAPFRTASGYDFLLTKSGTLPKGAAAEITRILLESMRADKSLERTLRFVPKTLDEKATLISRAERVKKMAASAKAGTVKLSVADLEALIHTREASLAALVLRDAQATLGKHFELHADEPETRTCVAEYFACVPHPPVWPVMARALCEMKTNRGEQYAMDELAASLKRSCPRDEPEPLEILLEGLTANYSYPERYGPEAGLRAIGGDRAIAEILKRVAMNPPLLPDQAIYLLPRIDAPGRPATVAALIRLASDPSFSARDTAMRVTAHYTEPQFDTALLQIARDVKDGRSARALAIEILGKRGNRNLRESIEDIGREDPGLRWAVASTLDRFGDKASLPLLATWLDEPGRTAGEAAYTMGRITRKYFINGPAGVEDARRWWKEHGAER